MKKFVTFWAGDKGGREEGPEIAILVLTTFLNSPLTSCQKSEKPYDKKSENRRTGKQANGADSRGSESASKKSSDQFLRRAVDKLPTTTNGVIL